MINLHGELNAKSRKKRYIKYQRGITFAYRLFGGETSGDIARDESISTTRVFQVFYVTMRFIWGDKKWRERWPHGCHDLAGMRKNVKAIYPLLNEARWYCRQRIISLGNLS